MLDVCRAHPHHTFLFLSKDVWAYDSHHLPAGECWPTNTMQGLTLTLDRIMATAQRHVIEALAMLCPRPYLSIEPIMGPLLVDVPDKVETVIVGTFAPRTPKQYRIPPKPEWIASIKEHVPAEKIYWKPNIHPYLPSPRVIDMARAEGWVA
jgi:hypothetical protein